MIVFDIETGPLPQEQLEKMIPVYDKPEPPEKMLPFDAASVKLGQMKDKEKIAAKIHDAEVKHVAAWRASRSQYAADTDEHREKFIERAALSPLTGQVLAIGYLDTDRAMALSDIRTERSLLEGWWFHVRNHIAKGGAIVGHNIFGFDLPFLIRRSWFHDIAVPPGILKQNRYWHEIFVDTMTVWQCGNNRDPYAKLDTLAKFFGIDGKPDGTTGADFARMLEEDRPRAEEYLKHDLEMTMHVATAMGLM